MDSPNLTVLCITGWCRNGSTILGNILDEVPGLCHVGEMHFLWKNAAGMGANSRCGCGLALTECPLWSAILPLRRPAGMSLADHADQVVRRQRGCVRTRHTWRILRHGLRDEDLRAHASLMAGTYHAVAERTGARVIVDTSKMPGEAALLSYLDGVTPYYVQLVRDPRAVAESWRQPKQYVYAMSAAKSTGYWLGFNIACEAIMRRCPRSRRIRYEEFIADPAGTVGSLLRWCGAGAGANPVRGRTVELGTNHTVTGNPDRFRTGVTTIRDADDAWRAGLSTRAKLAAVTLSLPLSRRYGYRYPGTFRDGAPAPAPAEPRPAGAPAEPRAAGAPAAGSAPPAAPGGVRDGALDVREGTVGSGP